MLPFLKTRCCGLIALAIIATGMVCIPSVLCQPIGQMTINYIEASNLPGQFVNQVRAYVTVSSLDESPITGLTAQDFEVREDGRPVSAAEASQAIDPMAVVLAIDTSGSMQARDKSGRTSMGAAKGAAVDFVSMLSDGDRLAIYSFNREPVLALDFSTDRDLAVQTLNGVTAKTKAPTCLYDTAYQAIKKAAEIPMGRRAIILLTDGKDEKGGGRCSTYGANDVIDAATTKTIRVPIYTIGVGPKVDAQELGRISKLTGGRNLLAKSTSELAVFYQIIANQLKNQYVVKYETQTPSGEHSLVLKVRSGEEQAQDEKRFWLPPLPVLRPPEVTVTGPGDTGEIKAGEAVGITVEIEPADTVAKVRYYVDALLKKEAVRPPFDTFEWDTTGLQTGLHVVRIEAIDIRGQTGYAEMTRKVLAPPPPKPEPALAPAAPAPAVAPPPEAPKPFPLIPVIGIALVVLAVGGGAAWWMMQRKKEAPPAGPAVPMPAGDGTEDIEDETMFMPDFGDTAEAPPATLSVVESMTLDTGTTFELTGRVTVGRTDRNDINIPDKPVSRKHGEIYFEDGSYHIRDLGSQNGIRLDGKRVSMDGVPLQDGVEIQLGPRTILKFFCAALVQDADFDDATKHYDM